MRNAAYKVLLVALLLIPAAVDVTGQNNPRDAERLIKALGVEPGMTVAEIGAGSGELSVLLARYVGDNGRLYSTEINQERLGEIRKAVAAASLGNVTVLEAGAETT